MTADFPICLTLGSCGLTAARDLPSGMEITNDGSEAVLRVEKSHCFALCPLIMEFKEKTASSLKIVLGESARLTLVERHELSSGQNIDMRVNLAAQAKLVHGRIEKENGGESCVTRLAVTVGPGAFYDSFVFRNVRRQATCAADIFLDGDLAEARLAGAQVLRGTGRAQTTWNVFHRAPGTVSRQTMRTVLDDKAEAVFSGRIKIEKGARKADGLQDSKALILSDDARMRAKPELEIYEDDVRCAHGATTGDLDEDALFYLRARGLGENEARALLSHAFVEEIIAQVRDEDMRGLFQREAVGEQAA